MAFAEEPLLAEGLPLAVGRRKELGQIPGLEERRKAAPDMADPEWEAACGANWTGRWARTGSRSSSAGAL